MPGLLLFASGTAPVRSPLGRDAPNPVHPHGPRAGARSAGEPGVRHGLGRAVQFGRHDENSFALFALPAPNRGLRRTENPRVDGSIPSLATTPKFLIGNGFLAPVCGDLLLGGDRQLV